eukprot:gene802-4090_t
MQRNGPLLSFQEHPALFLDENPLRFDPVSPAKDSSHVIFDEVNCDIFVVKDKGRRIQVRSEKEKPFIISLERESDIKSLRFSLDRKLLGIKRTSRSVSFVNLDTGRGKEFQQTSKSRATAQLRDFYWTGDSEIIFVSSHGFELYQIIAQRQQAKLLKNISLTVSFSLYCSAAKLLVIVSSLPMTTLNPFFITGASIVKIPRLQVEAHGGTLDEPSKLTNNDTLVAVISIKRLYCDLRVVLTKVHFCMADTGSRISSLSGISQNRKGGCHLSHVLVLRENGRFMINIVDNLVVVNSQFPGASFIFDIKSRTSRRITLSHSSSSLRHAHPSYITHYPIIPETRIAQRSDTFKGSGILRVEPYSRNWIAFQPNIIIDPAVDRLIDSLIRRTNARQSIICAFFEALTGQDAVDVSCISRMFNIVNRAYRDEKHSFSKVRQQSISQTDIYVHLFNKIRDEDCLSSRVFIAVVLEYIRSLNKYEISIEHDIYDLLISILADEGNYYQLHQLLQYHVIDDSKPLACRLLSIKSKYKPALQLAMDMFKRLGDSQDQIFHVLVAENQVISAMHYLRALGSTSAVSQPGSRLLSAVKDTGDTQLFITAFEFFQERSRSVANDFAEDDYQRFLAHKKKLQQCVDSSPTQITSVANDT